MLLRRLFVTFQPITPASALVFALGDDLAQLFVKDEGAALGLVFAALAFAFVNDLAVCRFGLKLGECFFECRLWLRHNRLSGFGCLSGRRGRPGKRFGHRRFGLRHR